MTQGPPSQPPGQIPGPRDPVRATIHVLGRVQGVFYRHSTMEEAMRLGLYGEVRNLPDGSVEVIAEGEKRAVDDLAAWCRQGPPAARVDEVLVRLGVHRGEFQTFKIAR